MLTNSSDVGNAPVLDPLSEILQDLRLSGVSYGRCEMTRPWGIELRAQAAARFHFVAEGECWARGPELGEIALHAGDVMLLPLGTAHALSDSRGGAAILLEDLPKQVIGDRTYRVRGGGGGDRSLLFCCSLNFADPSIHPLLDLMPPALLVRGAANGDPALLALLEIMADEVVDQRVGAATVMTRLADVVTTRVIRAWVEGKEEGTTGWLAAIRDPKIGKTLAAMHRDPGHPWSVASLAKIAGSSRSMFSERFTAVVGEPPAHYLARRRMRVASVWLRNERVTVAEAAARLGYESEASFSRAFKRVIGSPPSALRRSE
ncbi:AraC family transcriptional regulator [Capsulimonas corticalis]|uniref:AraC family transcriptional regulator n=1 Tax=Capsulimonas corticalis TaxID=2219043 RepID=A0A402CTV3_9BACT|nr:AraC family transcriptional regulator [Capsulimonas corticalis]BDI28759.1 AraC family transcriptional regulator [Capsulimonas corticalis]